MILINRFMDRLKSLSDNCLTSPTPLPSSPTTQRQRHSPSPVPWYKPSKKRKSSWSAANDYKLLPTAEDEIAMFPYPCPFELCRDILLPCELQIHLVHKHQLCHHNGVTSELHFSRPFVQAHRLQQLDSVWTADPQLITAFGQLFVAKLTRQSGMWYLWVWVALPPAKAVRYGYRVTLLSRPDDQHPISPHLEWTFPSCPSLQLSTEDILRGDCDIVEFQDSDLPSQDACITWWLDTVDIRIHLFKTIE